MPIPQSDQLYVHILSLLTLSRDAGQIPLEYVKGFFKPEQRADLLRVAHSHHVVIRGLSPLQQEAALAGHSGLANWAFEAILAEEQRINRALGFLGYVCRELEQAGFPVTVIKTLEHWPDLGSDLDLYAAAEPQPVVRFLTRKLNASVQARSWGDRLADKWNLGLPGLPEWLEIHFKRLGQTGEHTALARRFVSRRVFRCVQGYSFPVPAPEECVIVATLQRMYRHFYFRLSDILNTAALVESGALDYRELRRAAEMGGMWPGVASYLMIVSDYVRHYRGEGLALPDLVTSAAAFGGNKLSVRNCFLRIPVFPEGARLYVRQLKETALLGNMPAIFRLSLLPPLASAAAVWCRMTGSDKGIW
jgi:hypothetical protein